jgi:hypothetical protein
MPMKFELHMGVSVCDDREGSNLDHCEDRHWSAREGLIRRCPSLKQKANKHGCGHRGQRIPRKNLKRERDPRSEHTPGYYIREMGISQVNSRWSSHWDSVAYPLGGFCRIAHCSPCNISKWRTGSRVLTHRTLLLHIPAAHQLLFPLHIRPSRRGLPNTKHPHPVNL